MGTDSAIKKQFKLQSPLISTLFLLTILLRHNPHSIEGTHLKYTIRWFLTQTQNCATIIVRRASKREPG